ncbi:MAG: hypothetical protein ACM3SO_01655 [Betaproteobacteria bacterium]
MIVRLHGESPAACRACIRQCGALPKALLVLKDASVAADMRGFLESARWDVETFGSTAEALEAMRGRRTEVIVADCDGDAEAARLMRDASHADSKAKVVLVADDAVADAIAGMSLAPYVCLARPIFPRALLSVMSGALHDDCPAISRAKAPTRRIERSINPLFGAFVPMGAR